MKKLIISTIIKTVAVMLGLLMITAATLIMFAPVKLADFNKRIGNYSLAASFNIIEYNRSKDIETLAEIVNLSIAAKNNGRIIKYSDLLIKHTKFNDYCESMDEANTGNIYASYQQYVYGWNITALYKKGKKQQALDTAKTAVPADYGINNCFSYFIRAVIDDNDSSMAQKGNLYLRQLLDALSSSEEDVEIAYRILLDMQRLVDAGLIPES